MSTPTSSRGTTFNGGTVTAPLEVDPATGGSDAFTIHADPADTTNTRLVVDQHGNVQIHSGGTFQEASLSLFDNTSGNPGQISLDTFLGVGIGPESSANPLLTLTPGSTHTGQLL